MKCIFYRKCGMIMYMLKNHPFGIKFEFFYFWDSLVIYLSAVLDYSACDITNFFYAWVCEILWDRCFDSSTVLLLTFERSIMYPTVESFATVQFVHNSPEACSAVHPWFIQ